MTLSTTVHTQVLALRLRVRVTHGFRSWLRTLGQQIFSLGEMGLGPILFWRAKFTRLLSGVSVSMKRNTFWLRQNGVCESNIEGHPSLSSADFNLLVHCRDCPNTSQRFEPRLVQCLSSGRCCRIKRVIAETDNTRSSRNVE